MGNKVIIIKKEDGGVIRLIPNPDKFGEGFGMLPFSEVNELKKHIGEGRKWFVCDNDDLPAKSSLESRKQWYHDGDSVKADLTWEVREMPDQIIKKKHLKKLCELIDSELATEVPDPIALLKCQREHDKAKAVKAEGQNENPFWIEVALKNLDARVANGESDKPVIREKLIAKIQELNAKE